MRRLREVILMTVLLCILTVCPVLAEGEIGGKCRYDGEITWTLTNGTLYVEGAGAMEYIEIPTQHMPAVTRVVIEDGITEISRAAFYNLENLELVELPDSIKYLWDYAFYYCKKLSDVELPANLQWLGSSAFKSCAISSITFPDTLESIGQSAFSSCNNLTEITIPDNITHVGQGAFSYCENLKTVTIGKNVATMGDDVFLECRGLETVYWNATSVEDFGQNNGVFEYAGADIGGFKVVFDNEITRIPSYIFYPHINSVEGRVEVSPRTPHLTEVKLPSSLNTIGEYAFFGSIYLKDIVLPEKTRKIEESAFERSALETIHFPVDIETVEQCAFTKCDLLATITVDENNDSFSAVDGVLFNKDKTALVIYPAGKADSYYQIPYAVELIGTFAFSGNDYIANVTIPDSVTKIARGAFSECTVLEKIYIPDSVEQLELFAFYRCYALEEARLPEGITQIGAALFQECTSLKEITIPEGVREIHNYSFASCWDMTKVVLPESLISIGDSAFSGCTELVDIVLPENLTTIGTYAFQHCVEFTSFEIPKNVEEMGYSAFNLCMHLTDITLPKSLVKIGGGVFSNTPLKYVLYEGSISDWNNIERGNDSVLDSAKKYYNYYGQPLIEIGAVSRSGVTIYPINCDDIGNARLILAVYDNVGSLSKVYMQAYSEDAKFNVYLTKGKVKLMIWKSLLDPTPVAPASERSYNFTGGNIAENEDIGGSVGGETGGDAGGETGGEAGGEIIGGIVDAG